MSDPERAPATDVVFVVMPFADIGRPAIGVSLLKAAAVDAGWVAAIEYCNVAFADLVGADLYGVISSGMAPDLLVGEWVFAGDVFGDRIPPGEEYVERVLVRGATPDLARRIENARTRTAGYLDACAARIRALRPRVVGFTTTFHQTCACLAVARRLKEGPDPPVIVFGGANCEGEMGLQLLESFPWIDCVASGEADRSLPALLAVLLGDATGPVRGVVRRGEPAAVQPSEAIRDLDALPYPDYDDYFAELARSESCRDAVVHVVFETSRGCWWGAKHHCTFCGLNGDTMAFRSKSPERAFAEISDLARRYGAERVGCVDNILDMRYVDTLFPLLAASGLELELFYEVKANLRYDQLATLHRGGMRQIQPGIESFSNDVLRLMDKGVSALQNIQLLRWCEELGIDCAYNILAGFPTEPADEYARMAELVPWLAHLNPPVSCARLRLDRFSPFHARTEEFGFRRVRPARAYFYAFPLGRRELGRLAYFFDYDYDDDRFPEAYLEPLRRAVDAWCRVRFGGDDPPRLDLEVEDGSAVIADTRAVAVAERHELDRLETQVYAACDVATTIDGLLRRPELAGQRDGVERVLASLVERRLMLADAGRYLSLAVFRDRAGLPRPDLVRAADEAPAAA